MHIAADLFGDDAAPAVLFLHGGGQTRHAWGGAAATVAGAGCLAITMDHRGHGDSGWSPSGDYDTEGFVEDLLGVIAQLPSPPILVGASLGGIAALHAAGEATTPIARGLVLVDVTPRLEIPGVLRILTFMRAHPDGFASLEEAADFVASYLPHRPRPRDVSGLEKNLRRGDDDRWRWHWDPALMARWDPERYDVAEGERVRTERLALARRLRVPVMLVRGRSSDVVSEEGAREFLDAVPGARYVDLAAGHMVAGDRNDAFTDGVVSFVRDVRSR